MEDRSFQMVNGAPSVQQSENYGRKVETNGQEVSFHGKPIPEVIPKVNFEVADSQSVINKVTSMDDEQRRNVTIDSVHYTGRGITEVKLNTGDIVPIETAIALAENHMLAGYSTGKTVRGGRTLRSKPDPKNENWKSIHELPHF